MEQRPLRLGDILDDYCPRERRVTNHAIVAMVDEDIKQTRCTTCDAEHVYKGGKAPRRRKSETTARLYKEVLAGIESEGRSPTTIEPSARTTEEPEPEAEYVEPQAEAAPPQTATVADEPEQEPEGQPDAGDEGPVHRPLIRATLPRPEGVKVERQIPDFTIRHNGRGPNGNFRDARGGGRNGGNYGRFGRGQGRPGGGGGGRGQGRGTAQGFGRPGGGGQRHGGPKKRSR
jgi:hypothetical protein